MGSREKDHKAPHQPLLSSLVVRPTDSGGGGGGGAGAGSDYEPGEVRRDAPPFSRSDRHDGHGYRMRAGSVSPVRRRDAHHLFSPGFEHSDGARSRGFGNGRDTGRYRDYSPPYVHGKDGSRFSGRDFDRSARGPGSLRVEGLPRNNPNVRPREGDWICSDPSCKNLNFARREHCNNCNRPRYASSGSPRRGYPGPPFPPRQRVPAAPLDHSPGRIMNGGYRSPPRGWARDAPRDFRAAGPPARHEGRFPDPLVRSDRQDYPEDDPRDRYRYDRPMLPDWGHRDRGRDNYFNERRGYGRRPLSPPPAPAVLPRGWASNIRDRSRSPVRGGAQPRDYQRDIYMNRRRDDRRGVGRGAF
ncbi:TATA-binding protein-associated factor 2N [Sesamum angolense]|uniref:TATA-binding protein-associated factor 2N n=1 Tax=Sesamum angolense TaxID=2727404 RepID=A0AAE1WE94_9LAMI|nr:TATA-binding protein-associated factor 2N [Sesamum angolense]